MHQHAAYELAMVRIAELHREAEQERQARDVLTRRPRRRRGWRPLSARARRTATRSARLLAGRPLVGSDD